MDLDPSAIDRQGVHPGQAEPRHVHPNRAAPFLLAMPMGLVQIFDQAVHHDGSGVLCFSEKINREGAKNAKLREEKRQDLILTSRNFAFFAPSR
jgi:hypothetical protein